MLLTADKDSRRVFMCSSSAGLISYVEGMEVGMNRESVRW
jgi:preprotein translocase subunit Sec61beta